MCVPFVLASRVLVNSINVSSFFCPLVAAQQRRWSFHSFFATQFHILLLLICDINVHISEIAIEFNFRISRDNCSFFSCCRVACASARKGEWDGKWKRESRWNGRKKNVWNDAGPFMDISLQMIYAKIHLNHLYFVQAFSFDAPEIDSFLVLLFHLKWLRQCANLCECRPIIYGWHI